ncbi:nicotinate-nucleotide--dimethylbenzimidazole phosphoribosyltransferase [Pseudomonas sp. NCCP-436]|uniref:nicotinate-nucleotide--dimethylbenzimidazole phosphoribosyltransferase n=1 Tax=Pseudomonas sp. NCCP-436 TaxID=2842481 RepID=UPI001C7FBF9D|nr:nicotinate-nucleotide--dimethylbenzimidazole phosphoribosyltransferase [Pseudomonas sp. NCCP-436]GIZ11661.1 nicotinate-nucleotide--dimethylbenzimidazole phosphoribosyltransferase [Pseudomonas sp. NCCP-436]
MFSLPHLSISAPDSAILTALRHKIDRKTKPLGALGQLEALALQIGWVQQTLSPELRRPSLTIFAADHGLTRVGVSLYPAEVTAQMVYNLLAGGAATNSFARQHGFAFQVVDAGVNFDFPNDLPLRHEKIAHGTANCLEGPSMSHEQALQCLETGRRIAHEEVAQGSNVLAFGEMGIGNTSIATLLSHLLTNLPIAACTGRGTGLDDEGLARKVAILQAVAERVGPGPHDALTVLAEVGGFEVAMMTGAMLGTAEKGALILVDGFIATAALLTAMQIAPAVRDYAVFGHRSQEGGHPLLLAHLQATPLLQLGLRLGEGSGAVLAWPLLQAACGFLNEMASFESAGVSDR